MYIYIHYIYSYTHTHSHTHFWTYVQEYLERKQASCQWENQAWFLENIDFFWENTGLYKRISIPVPPARPPRNTLQHTATCCNTPQHTAMHCNALPHLRLQLVRLALMVYYADSMCSAAQMQSSFIEIQGSLAEIKDSFIRLPVPGARLPRNTQKSTATHYNSLQRTAAHCNTRASSSSTLQHSAMHWNTL